MTRLVLDVLLKPDRNDSLSGRATGEEYARRYNVLSHIEKGDLIRFVIDPKLVAINDTFVKGFFHQALHAVSAMQLRWQFEIDVRYQGLFCKCLDIEQFIICERDGDKRRE